LDLVVHFLHLVALVGVPVALKVLEILAGPLEDLVVLVDPVALAAPVALSDPVARVGWMFHSILTIP